MNFFEIFTRYQPKTGERAELAETHNVMFLRAKDGTDWYDAQKKFAADTMKLVIDDEGIICAFSRDITTLWPIDRSVAEVAYSTKFDDVWIDGGWQYRDGKVAPRVYTLAEQVEQAENKKSQLMAEANQKITPLQDAVDLGMATEAEVNSLTTWRTYRVLLSRVDTSTAPDVVWPEMPTV